MSFSPRHKLSPCSTSPCSEPVSFFPVLCGLQPPASPFLSLPESAPKPPFVFLRLRTLSFSVSSNPFACHSYENCRGVPKQFPFRNTPPSTRPSDSSIGEHEGTPVPVFTFTRVAMSALVGFKCEAKRTPTATYDVCSGDSTSPFFSLGESCAMSALAGRQKTMLSSQLAQNPESGRWRKKGAPTFSFRAPVVCGRQESANKNGLSGSSPTFPTSRKSSRGLPAVAARDTARHVQPGVLRRRFAGWPGQSPGHAANQTAACGGSADPECLAGVRAVLFALGSTYNLSMTGMGRMSTQKSKGQVREVSPPRRPPLLRHRVPSSNARLRRCEGGGNVKGGASACTMASETCGASPLFLRRGS
jgi:hypothetical protein